MGVSTVQHVTEVRLGFMLGQLDGALRTRMHQTASGFGLTVDEWSMLACVYTQTCSPGDLREIGPDERIAVPPEAGRLLLDLENKRMLRRDRDDHSPDMARLTRKGHQIVTGMLTLNQSLMLQATSGMTAEEIVTAVSLLERMHRNLA
ncbi:MAG: MarR family winged helix-turn-helix transcriptional regulator [Actinomycetota bacterium]|nr:MarR family winged helix-turn-helix transcriptional regulator [Actinomycetota bacterium]